MMAELSDKEKAALAELLIAGAGNAAPLSRSAVVATGQGLPSTAFSRLLSPEALIASGIVGPSQIAELFSGAEQSALQEMLDDYAKEEARIRGEYNVTAPSFISEIESRYQQNPQLWGVVGPVFQQVKSGVSRPEDVATFATSKLDEQGWLEYFAGQPDAAAKAKQFAGKSLQQVMESVGLPEGTFTGLLADISDYSRDAQQFRQRELEFNVGLPERQARLDAELTALGARPTAGDVNTFAARLDLAKSLGVPALALLPDPSAGPQVTSQQLSAYLGGGGALSGIQSDIQKQIARARAGMSAAPTTRERTAVTQGYLGRGREAEGVAPFASLPFDALRSGGGAGVYQRLAAVPESDRTVGLSGAPAATAGRAPQAPTRGGGMTRQQIAALEAQIAARRAGDVQAGLDVLRGRLASQMPDPFQSALSGLLGLGAFEARV